MKTLREYLDELSERDYQRLKQANEPLGGSPYEPIVSVAGNHTVVVGVFGESHVEPPTSAGVVPVAMDATSRTADSVSVAQFAKQIYDGFLMELRAQSQLIEQYRSRGETEHVYGAENAKAGMCVLAWRFHAICEANKLSVPQG